MAHRSWPDRLSQAQTPASSQANGPSWGVSDLKTREGPWGPQRKARSEQPPAPVPSDAPARSTCGTPAGRQRAVPLTSTAWQRRATPELSFVPRGRSSPACAGRADPPVSCTCPRAELGVGWELLGTLYCPHWPWRQNLPLPQKRTRRTHTATEGLAHWEAPRGALAVQLTQPHPPAARGHPSLQLPGASAQKTHSIPSGLACADCWPLACP